VAWTCAIAVAVIPTNAYLFVRAVPRHVRRYSVDRPPPRLKDIRSFLVPDSVGALFLLASTALLPLLIIDRLGPRAAGHYALPWIIGYSLFLVSLNMGSSLVVETAADQTELRQRCLRTISHLAKLLTPAVALIIAGAPYLLAVFGRSYARVDVTPLRLLALAALPTLITNTAISVTRSQRRMRVVLGIQVSICILVWVLSVVLMNLWGITGVAAAWLIAQTATALALILRPRLWLPGGNHDVRQAMAKPIASAYLIAAGRGRSALDGRTALTDHQVPATPLQRDIRWDGAAVRVTSPAPTEVWQEVAATDSSTMPFQTPAWRDCVCLGGGWQDASRLYEMPGGRRLVLIAASRGLLQASWPRGWGSGGVLAPGGVRPEEVAVVSADLAVRHGLSATVRPGFTAASAWSEASRGVTSVTRAVHVAHFEGSFENFWAASVSAKTRSNIRAAQRHLERAGAVVTSGNSPELVHAFYESYLRWSEWHARQRKLPAPPARWRAQWLEPLTKFAAVAGRLASDCRIWVVWLEGQPVAGAISIYSGDTAAGWRLFADRSLPAHFRLSEILIVESIKHACESGCRYLEMGESVLNDKLAGVKARFGGREYVCREYCFERLPIAPSRVVLQSYRHQVEDWIIARRRVGARAGRGHQ
jgi:hypothetical protein